ncbi:hypothetical protein DPMN_101012 [Dreissena polymorpha]|uniref:Uncharacterized protein n=1 Tax=Dreissena polymorpha TaxID=45954 RepID=A0A9D4R8Q4_DREPO|nr:hypothetical protein DPMN_101012 [Dreissena polymorpha]
MLKGVLILAWCLGCFYTSANPLVKRQDISNSDVCHTIYHGKCINTREFQCNGIAIPGLCGNATHFSFTDSDLTVMQCCNGWSIQAIGPG